MSHYTEDHLMEFCRKQNVDLDAVAKQPVKYTTGLFEQKCGVLFQHVLEKYPERLP